MNKTRAKLNKTMIINSDEKTALIKRLIRLNDKTTEAEIMGKTIHSDFFDTAKHLPEKFIDLLFVDPPYNMTKNFNGRTFKELSEKDYFNWFARILDEIMPALKITSSIYVCCDWKTSPIIYEALKERFIVRNRITWEREKGRGAKNNWKNNTEDIWFSTVSDNYYFNIDAVKIQKKVIAPYTNEKGEPKDWVKTDTGNYRATHPSNIWTDITVPFWSMPENTDHPTQKPEKLLAKIILASSKEGDFVFDPFLGSGTTSVVAKKLARNYSGIEKDETYCCLTEKRLILSENNKTIQGYESGVFTERNFTITRRIKQ